MNSNSNVRWSRWKWNADSVHSCHWIVSSVTLFVFQLYLEHLIYFWNVSSVTWNAFSVIRNAFSVNTIHVSVKGEMECVWCSMLKNFKGPLKIDGSRGAAVHVRGMHPHLEWNRVLLLVMSHFIYTISCYCYNNFSKRLPWGRPIIGPHLGTTSENILNVSWDKPWM
jgi:hypothetical protein